MSADNSDRRRYPRSRSGFDGITSLAEPGLLNHVDNISCNGVLCHTNKAVPLMTKMSIVLELPGPEPRTIDAAGVVVRCSIDDRGDDEIYRVAILYTRLTDDDHKAIKDFVEQDIAETAS